MLTKGRRDVHGVLARLGDLLAVVLAEPVERGTAQHLHAHRRDVGELDGVVRLGEDGFADVLPDLLAVDVEGRHELDIADVVRPELDVHEAGHLLIGRGMAVELHALHQRGGAVADAHDGHSDLVVRHHARSL